jgi:large subunit ribosomal protein L21
MYAVVTSGGKQYRVEAGTELIVERVPGDAGATITFDRVLLVGDGEAVTVGTPTVEGATVSGTVLGEALGPKLIVFKFKQKATYRRKNGHRQHLTRVRIDEISAGGQTSKAAPKAEAAPKAKAASKAKAAPKATEPEDGAAAETKAPARKPARKAPAKAKAKAGADADAAEPAATDDESKPKATRRRAPAKKATPKAEAEE